MLTPHDTLGLVVLGVGLAGLIATAFWGEYRSRRVVLCFDSFMSGCGDELVMRPNSVQKQRIRIKIHAVPEIDAIRISPQSKMFSLLRHRDWWRHNDTSGLLRIKSVQRAEDDGLLPEAYQEKPDQRHGHWLTFSPPLPVGRDGSITVVVEFESKDRHDGDLGVRIKTPKGDLYDHRPFHIK